MPSEKDIAEIAGKLTKAQREAVHAASFSHGNGAWHPEGWYCAADKRVRRVLAACGLTRDYLRRSNRLTPFGIAVRDYLTKDTNHGT